MCANAIQVTNAAVAGLVLMLYAQYGHADVAGKSSQGVEVRHAVDTDSSTNAIWARLLKSCRDLEAREGKKCDMKIASEERATSYTGPSMLEIKGMLPRSHVPREAN